MDAYVGWMTIGLNDTEELRQVKQGTMKHVYIAGPYRADNAWEVEQNIRRAEELSYEVSRAGAVAICPHAQNRYLAGTLTEEFWLRATLSMLSRCDCVLLVAGWSESSGTKSEIEYADKHELPVFYDVGAFKLWLDAS